MTIARMMAYARATGGPAEENSTRKVINVRVGNLGGRLVLVVDGGAVDVARASDQRFGPDPQAVYACWEDFSRWAATVDPGLGERFTVEELGAPVPRPSQVFAVGLNYREHAAESGFDAPQSSPPVFTKFPSCIAGPYDDVVLPSGGNVDWEVELVAVIGRSAKHVRAEDAWDHVAGLTVGQDLSERILQFAATPPQFSLAKSHPGFGPLGPVVVSVDEFVDPDDLAIECSVAGEVMQSSRTSKMIFSVGQLIAQLSAVTRLGPGDLVFTGTPSGVGVGRTPPVFLRPGDELISRIEGIGSLRNVCVGAGAQS